MPQVKTVEGIRDVIGEPHPLVSKKVIPALDDVGRRFITAAPLAMLSTANAEGHPDVSPRGDGSGFAHIADDKTLYLPERPGNKLAYSLQNILINPKVALLFVIPGVVETYRVHGAASIIDDADMLQTLEARGQPALLAIKIDIEACFLHCGKAMIRSKLWKTESQAGKHAFKFGQTIAEVVGDETLEDAVNALVEEDYRDNL